MRRARIQRVVTRSQAPARRELINALQIPAGLRVEIVIGEERARGVRDLATFFAMQVFALHLELTTRRWRPLDHAIDDPGVRITGEGLEQRFAGCVRNAAGAIFGFALDPGQAGAPARVVADITAHVREQRRGIEAIARTARRRVTVTVARLCAELN